MYPPFSLDQLTAFVAVIDEGSFSAAGRRLGRVQSAVSYTIAQLEEALGCALFDRSGRTPRLTPEGRRLEAEARRVLGQARDLWEVATGMQGGLEPELVVVVDVLYPPDQLARIAAEFADRFPATSLRLEGAMLDEGLELVRDGQADLGACNLGGRTEDALWTWHLGEVRLVPVVSSRHRLAGHPGRLGAAALRQAIQVVLSRRGSSSRDLGVLSSRTWRVADQAMKLRLIREGIGWGSLPWTMVRSRVDAGELVALQPEPWPEEGHRVALHAVSRHDEPLGRAGQWFREQLAIPSA